MSETILAADGDSHDLMEHHFRAILEAVDLPITLIDSTYEYRWVNNCYAIAHGKEPSEFVGKKIPDIWGRDTFDMAIKKNLDTCLGGHTVKEEAWVDFPVWGRRYCETIYSSYASPVDSCVIVVTYDITDRKKIENQLKDYQERLENLVEGRTAELKESEHNLKEANIALTEANTALKVLLQHREQDRKELEEKFLTNVQQLVLPHVEKLKRSALNPVQQTSINFIRSNLSDLISPFVKTIRDLNFTPRQLEVATLIRDGRTTKDIAGILNISKRAVDIQRFLIRKKLGLNKAKINLQAYLKSLS